jgi:hypothetical protein
MYKFCISGDKGAAVSRTYVDYCVYGDGASVFPTGPLTTSFTSAGEAVSGLCAIVENIPCATSYVCLTGSSNCTVSCDGTFLNFSGKIRVFFPSSIPAGVANPSVTSVMDGVATLSQFKLCASDDALTNVERTFVDYCIYSDQVGQAFPATALLTLSTQLGSLTVLPCAISSVTLSLPKAFASINPSAGCSSCDPGFTNYYRTIRVFFPGVIPVGVSNPEVTAIDTNSVVLPGFKFCAQAGNGVNSQRPYVDYCVYTSAPGGSFPPGRALGFTMKTSDCSVPFTSTLDSTAVVSCINMNNVVYSNITTGPNGAGGVAAGCTDQTTCLGVIVYFAGNMTLSFSPCIPAGVAAPAISSFTRTAADGSIIRYCVTESSSSSALIGNIRCSIQYCVTSTLSNDQYLATAPVLDLNAVFNVTVAGSPQLLTQDDCEAANIVLPVKFGGFKASRAGDKVLLDWDTYSESNNKGFFIQRNTTGTWVYTGFVNTKADFGNSSLRLYYGFTDLNSFTGITQYRLQQVDFDGKAAYSDIRVVKGSNMKFSVYPNPSPDGRIMVVIAGTNDVVDLSVRNSMGQEIRTFKNVQSGTFPIANLGAGYYTLQLIDHKTGTSSSVKFIVISH